LPFNLWVIINLFEVIHRSLLHQERLTPAKPIIQFPRILDFPDLISPSKELIIVMFDGGQIVASQHSISYRVRYVLEQEYEAESKVGVIRDFIQLHLYSPALPVEELLQQLELGIFDHKVISNIVGNPIQ